jgi:Mlc titration factor MtfA (ptsG expression regulator)
MRFESRRKRRQREVAELEFADEWRSMLLARWPLWSRLSDDERSRLEDLTKVFVAEKRWEAANGFELTESMQVLIAAQACLLVLELEGDLFRGVGSILVHPTTIVLEGQRSTGTGGLVSSDPYPILGQAQFGGPTIVAWDTVSYDAHHPARGQNVVYHEFAHKLDMLDGVIDGTPPLLDASARQRWVEVCTREFRALTLGTGGTLLRDYGSENPGEFFAVATEGFFSRPVDMLLQKPDLYEVLSGFYRQDPAIRFPAPVEHPGPQTLG